MSEAAMVTGANRGIGKAIALDLADAGHNLVLLARDKSLLEECAGQCLAKGVKVQSIAGELADEAYMDSAVEQASEVFGGVSVLINNAGAAHLQPVQQADTKKWRDIMEVNFNAAVYLSSKILPQMIERQSGAVINISSISGRMTSAGSAIYCASKHALNGFTECMFEDVREYGIKVASIMPGFVDTQLTQGRGLNGDKMLKSEDVAQAVRYVLSASPGCCPTEIVLRPQVTPL